MSARPVDPLEVRRRLKAARIAVDKGWNATMYADRIGLTRRGAEVFLRQHAPSLYEQLASGRRQCDTPYPEALRRLRVLKAYAGVPGGLKRAAAELRITPAGLCQWRQHWAPDGLDAAIALLSDDDDADMAVSA